MEPELLRQLQKLQKAKEARRRLFEFFWLEAFGLSAYSCVYGRFEVVQHILHLFRSGELIGIGHVQGYAGLLTGEGANGDRYFVGVAVAQVEELYRFGQGIFAYEPDAVDKLGQGQDGLLQRLVGSVDKEVFR